MGDRQGNSETPSSRPRHPYMMGVSFVSTETLADWLLESPERVVVIDVRDSDYEVGRVRGSLHCPFSSFDAPSVLESIPEFTKDVVIYCHYSQMRGPSAAATLLDYVSMMSMAADKSQNSLCSYEGAPFRVNVLKGGFSAWHDRYYSNHNLYENLSGKLSRT